MSDQSGLVISYFGNSVAVETNDGQVFQCHLRRNQDLPVVGDRVLWQPEGEDGSGIVLSIEPRSSLLSRGDARGELKAIAANINAIAIVMSPFPVFSEYLVDRYLIASELLSIPAIIVLNKADLLNDESRQLTLDKLAIYKQIPYTVICSSIYEPDGLQPLSAALKGKCSVLVGPSGVGKSSIIAALTGEELIRVSEVSVKGIGKHTTTATRLYHLPQGGSLIDSPGVREFNLWRVNKAEVLKGFCEFAPFLNQCKFRDCQHLVEPGCVVLAAVADGKISPERFSSYKELIKHASIT
jgi:ribosome biogenesis GTPase